jgi:hypothetical protein
LLIPVIAVIVAALVLYAIFMSVISRWTSGRVPAGDSGKKRASVGVVEPSPTALPFATMHALALGPVTDGNSSSPEGGPEDLAASFDPHRPDLDPRRSVREQLAGSGWSAVFYDELLGAESRFLSALSFTL